MSHRIIYHYTSIEAFYKIANSKALWATDTQFLNDISELEVATTALGGLESLVAGYWAKTDLPIVTVRTELLGRFMKAIKVRCPPTYVVSFSSAADDLSQWTGYGGQGTGISMGINEEFLKKIAGEAKFEVDDCRYGERGAASPTEMQMLGGLLKIFDAFPVSEYCDYRYQNDEYSERIADELTREKFDKYFEDTFPSMVAQLAKVKHSSWKREEEVRVIRVGSSTDKVQYRTTSNQLIPYIEFPLTSAEQESLIIDELFFWGAPFPENTRNALNGFLESKNIKTSYGMKCECRPSSIPFRSRYR